jgi:hypothetical protein
MNAPSFSHSYMATNRAYPSEQWSSYIYHPVLACSERFNLPDGPPHAHLQAPRPRQGHRPHPARRPLLRRARPPPQVVMRRGAAPPTAAGSAAASRPSAGTRSDHAQPHSQLPARHTGGVGGTHGGTMSWQPSAMNGSHPSASAEASAASTSGTPEAATAREQADRPSNAHPSAST